MTVPAHHDAPSTASEPMDPQAAVELAQELTLVATSLFAQLLPSTSAHAITGVPGLAGKATSPEPAVAPTAQVEETAAAMPAGAASEPAAVAVPGTPAGAPMVPVAVPVPSVAVTQVPMPAPAAAQEAQPTLDAPTAIPVPTLPVDVVAPDARTTTPGRSDQQHSLAMLEEIGFLDE